MGRPYEALEHLERAERTKALRDHTPSSLLALKAIAEARIGNPRAASTLLRQAADAVRRTKAFAVVAETPLEFRGELGRMAGVDPEQFPVFFPEARPNVHLTPREHDVLSALEHHQTVKEIAAALHVSANTAKTHLHSLYRKLGVHDREELLRAARRNRTRSSR